MESRGISGGESSRAGEQEVTKGHGRSHAAHCCSRSHLILLLLHLGQQELGVDVALLQEMLQPLVAHVVGVPLPRLASLLRWTTGWKIRLT